MKKFILVVALASTFVMCKKGDASNPSLEKSLNSVDSIATSLRNETENAKNSAETVLDSANIKIKDFDKTKNDVRENIEFTSKSIDSLTNKIANINLESKLEKKDSSDMKAGKIVVNVPSPKIIRETKVVYKEKPKKDDHERYISGSKMVKTGHLVINVNDAENAKEIVKDQVRKYDGFIKSENISSNNNEHKTAYLKVKVPIQKFDYLMEDLSYNIGEVENKGIDIKGDYFVSNTLCDVEITLYGNVNNAIVNNQPEGFGTKSMAAVSSGWNVITAIFLFILPLWPLFLIAGIGYYFYKKKKNNISGNV